MSLSLQPIGMKTFTELEFADFYLDRAIKEADVRERAEMLYEVVNLGLKALADYFYITDGTRSEIAIKLSDILGSWVSETWDLALSLHYYIYVDGIIDEEFMKEAEKRVEDFIKNVKEVIYE
ncbi:MAG: hypothetical protein OWQ54_02720 [Sulfolobaceae archaeon]|nr:hypothetical protein [Sulfolobaceae archaeon]